MSEPLFLEDAYLQDCEASVIAINERGGIVLDRTVFYANSGGQPGDLGALQMADGTRIPIATTVYDSDRKTIVHVPADGSTPPPTGSSVIAQLNWDQRHGCMRMHTCLHLLCALVKFPVTGGKIGTTEGRLDFDISDASAITKEQLTTDLNALITADHPVSSSWITDEELAAQPELVRTMAVQPPQGFGRIRLISIGDNGAVDLQPCGGTHVRSTAEIGPVVVRKIEKKGRQNRRVRVAFV